MKVRGTKERSLQNFMFHSKVSMLTQHQVNSERAGKNPVILQHNNGDVAQLVRAIAKLTVMKFKVSE